MAEMLVMRKDNGDWKTGDIVHVAPDGHPWGKREIDERIFRIIKVPNLSVDELREHCKPWKKANGQLVKSQWSYNAENSYLRCKKTKKKVVI